ncbi:sesquipedalian-1 isoform X2 [Protopterus annectens]|uniref:sesquipedalian-1 isoform X2 n=1 Tax=Protopterus annectens TaxID=7888 RepID=UPI001CFAD048|nr:sesquipedalian-1 isoform X2 [Protopterus annectens]
MKPARMKLNERSVVYYATCDSPADMVGYLYKKGERNTAYHRRWFVLKGNMLFYFEEKDSKEPIGVVILEGCTVELCESSEEHAFAIKFECAKSRTYKMAADTYEAMESWVKALSRASFDYMRLVVKELEKQLEEMQKSIPTGSKPKRRIGHSKKIPSNHHIRPPAIYSSSAEECIYFGSPVKENGCASWNNLPVDSLPNGHESVCSTGSCNSRPSSDTSSELTVIPPPLPPRRRPPTESSASVVACQTPITESPVSPGTVCFARLHDWYGREVIEIRKQWQGTQKDVH